jgi:hypothetical protein
MKCEYKPIERAGLYIMVFFILLNTCDLDIQHKEIIDKFNNVENRIELIEKGTKDESDN